jgi:hypothetical protein
MDCIFFCLQPFFWQGGMVQSIMHPILYMDNSRKEEKPVRQGRKFIAGMLVLILLCGVVTAAASYVTKPYDSKTDKVEKTLYSDDEDMNEVEVALIGGSHANNGFNPTAMWKNSRIKAYNFSFSGEPMYLTYYYLKELFKKRSFRLVVVDLYYIGLQNKYFSHDSYVFDLLKSIKWSQDKVDFIQNCVSLEERWKYYFPLYSYHSRWSELTEADFLRTANPDNDFWLGSDYHFERYAEEPVSFEKWNDTDKIAAMSENSETYLRKVIELIQENGCEVLLTGLPHRYNDASAPDTWVSDEYTVYNHAKKIAAEYGVNVLQYNDKILDEIGFVPEEDMYNKGHMNIYGSEKVSAYLGEYIKKNYEVTQFSEEKEDLWDVYLGKYEEAYQKNYCAP